MTRYKVLTRCRLCEGSSLVSVLDLGTQALTGVFPRSAAEAVTEGPLEVVLCEGCSLVQLAHTYDSSEMYGENYGYRSGLNRSMVEHLGRKTAGIESLIQLNAGDVVLDIGSNDATLLKSYGTAGLTLVGMDPTAEKFRSYYPDHALIIPDFFSAARFLREAPKKARVITSIAMFYDLDAPVVFARGIAEALAHDGIWHFEQSYMPSMLRATSYDTVCHEHLEYYSLANIIRILEMAGLELIDVRFNKINGGSFAVTAAHRGSAIRPRRALIDWFIAQEQRMGLSTRVPFDAFAQRVSQHRDDLRQLLLALRAEGSRVVGYGASTKGNVLLQYCELTSDLLPCVAEVNPDKFGCVTPGTRIPIVSEEEARSTRPDYMLVLPWHFREGIIEREREFIRSGGRLIFPLSEIEIVGD